MDALPGFLADHGVSAFNAVLLAFLYVLVQRRVQDVERKVSAVYDWHLIQKGLEAARGNHVAHP
jgi:hypothetical protein